MRRGGSKAKGSSYERHICKLLSLWVTNGKREDVFWRSAMSGGRATVRNRKGKIDVRQAGDITAVTPEGHVLTDNYYIECKHVKKLALDQFLIKGTGTLAAFWKVAKREAYRHERIPVIIARQNGWPDIVITLNKGVFCPPASHQTISLNWVRITPLGDVLQYKPKLKAVPHD